VVGGAGQAVGGAGQGAGDLASGLVSGGDGASAAGDSSSDGGGGDLQGASAPHLAKEAVKAAAKQLGSAASDEAKDISLAATRKVMEIGEKRREKRADKHHATAAAMREAEDAGLDIEEIEGTGSDGRVTLRDVQNALKE
jgi:pyruvate/2-oxoglutarate dehydrogenase complex dihydrolipoamide acyltransferase (E2) component